MHSRACKFGSLTSYLGDWVYLNRTAVDIKHVLNRSSLCRQGTKSLEIQHRSYLLIVPPLSFCSSVSCHCLCHTVEAY